MPKPQSAILPESGDYAIYLTLTLRPGAVPAALRRACAGLPALTKAVARETRERSLTSLLGIGAQAWPRLMKSKPPQGLAPFKAIRDGARVAPSTPADLFVQITADRHAACFHLARRFMGAVGGGARLVEEVHGFRNIESRDLIGFVDGTENPKGAEVAPAALVGKEDAAFAGGTYVSIQRYVHDLASWSRQSVAAQEKAIGRTKKTDKELSDRRKPPTAHLARVVIEEDGEELQIVRRSLPYGTTGEAGLYFVALGRTPDNFRKMLTRMMTSDADGHYDHLMNFTRPVTGASFFAPSVEMLEGIG